MMVNRREQVKELLATYNKHGWRLRRVLVTPETRAAIEDNSWAGDAPLEKREFDALWFSRASQRNREAWELRLVGPTQYALFETFEADEPEEAREEVRKEMEARMRERVSGHGSQVSEKG